MISRRKRLHSIERQYLDSHDGLDSDYQLLPGLRDPLGSGKVLLAGRYSIGLGCGGRRLVLGFNVGGGFGIE